jgi:hypothetical protein
MDLPQMDQETRRQLAWHMEDQLGVPRNQDLFDGWRDRMGWAGMGRTFCWLFNPVIIKGKGSSTILDDFPIKAAVIRDFPASQCLTTRGYMKLGGTFLIPQVHVGDSFTYLACFFDLFWGKYRWVRSMVSSKMLYNNLGVCITHT